MMQTEYPASLQPEHLMEHMRAFCKDIGPRPSTSTQESQAADYVEKTLRQFAMTDVRRQPFKSQNSLNWIAVPCFVTGMLAAPMASFGGQWGKLAGGVLLLGSAYTLRQSLLTKPPFFQKLIARGESQNVIARVAAARQARRTIHLVGHLDSQKQRFQFPPSPPGLMKPIITLPIALGALGGLVLLASAFLNPEGFLWWLWLLAAAYLWGAAGAVHDETRPYVEGANDNATAMSILLGIAEALKAHPLQNSDVTLLFTGCEEVGCVGMEEYLKQFAPSKDNTYWIDIEMVGTGGLCYVTKHGVTYLAQYVPHPEMAELADRVARKCPELALTGKEMLIIEEVATLRNKRYKAICLAGYDETGFLPNWHRLSDNLDNIEPDTLGRAACYTWKLMQEIDNLE